MYMCGNKVTTFHSSDMLYTTVIITIIIIIIIFIMMSLERNPLLNGGELYLEMFSLQRIQFNSKLEENFPTPPTHTHNILC